MNALDFPGPREQLCGCVWLPRILAKARLFAAGELPEDYAVRFCHPGGVDGQFLAYFGLKKDEILAAASSGETGAAEWFSARFPRERIDGWNHIATNLGRPGFPLAERLPEALATSYAHLAGRGFSTVFEVLEADEERNGSR